MFRVVEPRSRTAAIIAVDGEVLEQARSAVERIGFEVVAATSDRYGALERIEDTRPGLVIIESELGPHSGLELARRLGRSSDAPILFVAGDVAPDLSTLADQPGVFSVLSKPITEHALHVAIDLVSLQDRTHARLRKLERHYHSLFERAAVGVAEIDARTGRVIDLNRRCAQIFGCEVEALRGTYFFSCLDMKVRDDILAVGEYVTELPLFRLDGSTVWARIIAAPLDGLEHHVLIIEDVTARRQTEEQLARHRQMLADSQRTASIGSFRYEYWTGELMWSTEMYRLHGVRPETFKPSQETIVPLVHPDYRAYVAASFSPPDPNAEKTSLRYDVVLPDGSVRRLLARGELLGASGNPTALVGTVQDITEREREATARLESEARERMAREANRAKTEFLAHMSHELRTPLNAVLGLSEALLEGVFGKPSDTQAEALATIHKSGRHLLDLINDVLDIARVESGLLPIDPQEVPLQPLLEESTALIFAQLTSKGQRLTQILPPLLPPVEVDRRRIKQVLLNLLGNASKFSPIGASIVLRVTVDHLLHLVKISIEDNGPGIAHADLDRIFEPFVSLDPSTSNLHGGAGLGLALAKRIVDLHKGSMEVISELGHGSRFAIVLPCAKSFAAEPPGSQPHFPRATTPRETSGVTVLVAEDNEATVFAVRSYLEMRGYAVRVVHDGRSAIEAATAPEVAAVLMDVQLNGLDGLEATRQIRARRESAHKPIIALTAHAMPHDEERCLAAGASAYMAKPVRLQQLVEKLEALL